MPAFSFGATPASKDSKHGCLCWCGGQGKSDRIDKQRMISAFDEASHAER